MAHLGKVMAQRWARRFDSCSLRQSCKDFAGIAHLVERLFCNQDVAGSIPAAGTNNNVAFDFG